MVLNESSAALVRRAVGNIVDSEAVPRITGGPLGRDNRFELRFRGAIGKTYRIEASDDLQSWTPLREFTNATPSSVFVESVTNSPLRYFRAVLLQ